MKSKLSTFVQTLLPSVVSVLSYASAHALDLSPEYGTLIAATAGLALALIDTFFGQPVQHVADQTAKIASLAFQRKDLPR